MNIAKQRLVTLIRFYFPGAEVKMVLELLDKALAEEIKLHEEAKGKVDEHKY